VRAKLAAFVNVGPENSALATSTTNGCNMVSPASGSARRRGRHDRRRALRPLGALAVSQVRLRLAPVRELPPEQALTALLAEVTPRTRAVALSHVCWMTGNRFPSRAEGATACRS
jgi:selenocysteine lyase/cysteine desulfurase